METCKVEFINNIGQKIILDFSLDEKGNLDYKPSFEPKVDPKTNLGLSGQLCEIFVTALINTGTKDTKVKNHTSKKRLES